MNQTPLMTPFTIIRDDRERVGGYRFEGIRGKSDQNYRPLDVQLRTERLMTGDYTLSGFEDLVTVERKSLADLYGTLADGDRRDRFRAEHERMAGMALAVVVIEASWREITFRPPAGTQLDPKTVYGTFIARLVEFGIPWFAMDDRRLAELTTFRILERFWQVRVGRAGGRAY